ncbi:hypothetical protein IQ782_28480 [Salipiger pacificus]|uniref:Uncharacterized protein n=1 Tax=Salipiger mangrovisoli TaxID=2865933 RepID=A0ABR9XBC5_9RHOB|nr:hypothetical protein [Salipiger mangrovisoli]
MKERIIHRCDLLRFLEIYHWASTLTYRKTGTEEISRALCWFSVQFCSVFIPLDGEAKVPRPRKRHARGSISPFRTAGTPLIGGTKRLLFGRPDRLSDPHCEGCQGEARTELRHERHRVNATA